MKMKRKQWGKGIAFLLILAICFGTPFLQLPTKGAQAASTTDVLNPDQPEDKNQITAKAYHDGNDTIIVDIYVKGSVQVFDIGVAYEENVTVTNSSLTPEFSAFFNSINGMVLLNPRVEDASLVYSYYMGVTAADEASTYFDGKIASMTIHIENGETPKLRLYKNTSNGNPEFVSEIPVDLNATPGSGESTATPEPEETAKPTATPEPEESAKPTATPEPEETAKPTATTEPEESAKPTATPEPDKTPIPTETTPPDAFEISGTADQTASIDSYTGTETELVIPEEINGYKLTAISADAFKDSPVTSIVLPESVTKIGAGAFAGSKLQSITITANEIEIAEDAFTGCGNLTIRCYSASKAYSFAKAHDIAVELLDAKPDITYGDLDGSGNVDANDALLILKIAAKLQTPTEEQRIAGDVNNSGSVDANDALDVLEKAAQLIDKFPAEEN